MVARHQNLKKIMQFGSNYDKIMPRYPIQYHILLDLVISMDDGFA